MWLALFSARPADLDEQLTTLFIKAGAQTLLHKPINIPQLKIWF